MLSVISNVRLPRFRLLSLLFYSFCFHCGFSSSAVSVLSFVPTPSSFSSSSFPFLIFLLHLYPYPLFVFLIPRFLLSLLLLLLFFQLPPALLTPPPFSAVSAPSLVGFLLISPSPSLSHSPCLLLLAFLLVLLFILLFLFSLLLSGPTFSTLRLLPLHPLLLFLRLLLHGFFLSSSFPPPSSISAFPSLSSSFYLVFLPPPVPFLLLFFLFISVFPLSVFSLCIPICLYMCSCNLWFHFQFSFLFSPCKCISPRFFSLSSFSLPLSGRFLLVLPLLGSLPPLYPLGPFILLLRFSSCGCGYLLDSFIPSATVSLGIRSLLLNSV